MSSKDTKAKPGNLLAEKYTEKRATKIFNEILQDAYENDYYSIQELVLANKDKVPYSTFYHLIRRFESLKDIKTEMDAIIMSVCNRGAMVKELSTPMAIWRLKQLGEVDKVEQEITQKNITVEI